MFYILGIYESKIYRNYAQIYFRSEYSAETCVTRYTFPFLSLYMELAQIQKLLAHWAVILGYEFLRAVTVMSTILRDLTPVQVHRRFGCIASIFRGKM
jgi:uncharacterized membrane protein YozB (DUF420 family)